ncbi:ankyrin repeat-containing domain protein [Annulohypoxylon moriforme]|nr:ankyrin repeat-containing domain protein [Annulohypoxylon moriforme]
MTCSTRLRLQPHRGVARRKYHWFQYAVAYLDYVLGLPTSCILSKLKDTPKDITELYNEIFDDIKFKPNWGPIVMRSFKWLQVHDGSSSSKLLLAAISQNSIGDSMGKYLEDIDKLLDACRFLLIRDDKFIRFSHESIRIFVQEYFMAEIEYRDFAATVILNTLLFYKPSAEPTLEIDELYQEALYNWRWYVYPLRNEKNVRYLLGKFFEKEPSPGYQDWLLYLADEILNLDFSDEEKANFVFSPREWLRPQESRIEYYYSIQSRLEGDSTRRLLMAFTAYYASKAKSTLATSSNFDEWEVLHLPDGYFSGSPTHNPQKSVVPTSKDLDDYENRNDGHGYVNHGKELQEMQLSYLHFSKWIASEFKSASFERESRFVRILQYSSTQPPEFQKQLARYFLLCVCSMPSDSDSCAQLADSTLINLNTYECQEYKYQHILEVCFNLSETLITPHFWDNSLDGYSMNVLYQPRIIEFLIDNGANVNFELGRHSTFSIYDFREDWTSFSDRMSSFILWERYGTPLIAAAAAYDAKNVDEIMSLLLDCGANINQVAEDGQYGTALIAACARPIKSAVERLLSLDGIDVNTRARKDGYSRYGTALIAACDNDKDHKDQYEIIEMLLEKGADVNITALTGSYGTALIAACSLDTASDGWGDNDQAGIINRLFKKGADTNITALAGYYGTALIAACAGCESGIVKIILERGAKVNTIVSIGHYGTALITACYFCDTNVVRMLLERDAEVNAEVLTGNYGTALIAACSAGANEIIHLLLAADANLNATVSVGDYGTAFSATCAKGKIRDVKQLLEKGAQPNISTEGVKYTSAFSAALAHKNIGIAITLLDQCEGIDSSSLPMIEDEVERMELFRGDYISTPDQIASLKDKEWKGQCQWATGRLSFALLCFSANQDLEWLKEDRQKAINYMSCFCHEENNLEAAYDMVYSLGVYVRKDAGVLENWRRVLREGPETVTSQGWDHFAGLLLGLFRDLCQSVYLGELEGR